MIEAANIWVGLDSDYPRLLFQFHAFPPLFFFFLFSRNYWPGDRLDCNETGVCVSPLHFSFFFFQPAIVDFANRKQCICALFTVPQITLFSNFFIKNGSHNTIYTFKNYFTTVFSVSVFSFNKNKLNPNTSLVFCEQYICARFMGP